MSQRQRLLLSVIAAFAVVGAFVVLRPSDDDVSPTANTSTASPPAATAADPSPAVTPEPAPPAPRPTYLQIRARGLKPVGGVKKIRVNKGDTVRLEVRSDRAEEGHLHGYDISKSVGPGKRALQVRGQARRDLRARARARRGADRRAASRPVRRRVIRGRPAQWSSAG